MSRAPRFIPRGVIPTSEQQAIQCSQHRISLIEANAGAAKTTTLALRIGEALARGLAPQQILGLVFTPEALAVLQQRLIDLGVSPFVVRKLALHTIEGFSRQTLAFWEESAPPSLATLHELKPIAIESLERLSLLYADTEHELDFRTHHVALSQFFQSQLRLKASLGLQSQEDESITEKALIAGVTLTDFLWTQQYEQLRQSPYEGVLFRGPFDGTYDLACALQESPDLLQLLPDYRLVVVDELHDANEASFQILRALLSKDKTYLVAAGDKDQVIYKQLAADASYLHERFAAYFTHLQTYPLSYTYRHGPYLAYAVAAFKKKKVDSALALGTQIHVHQYQESETELAMQPVLNAILLWQKQGGRLDQCAVLLRDEHQSIHLENSFLKAGIAYQLHGFTGYLQRDEILFLRGLMALALNGLSHIGSMEIRKKIVHALALFSEIHLADSLLQEAASEIAEFPQLLSTFYQGQIQRTGSEQGRWRISEALHFLEQVDENTRAAEVLTQLCEQLDMLNVAKRIYVFDHQATVIQKSIAGFIQVAADLQLSLSDFYTWCAQTDEAGAQAAQAVVVCTVAQAKGKEYEHVLMPLLEQGEFPSAKNSGQIEHNLFYVGITRTQKRLSLFVPQDSHKVSDYLAELQLEQVKAPALERLQQLQQQPYLVKPVPANAGSFVAPQRASVAYASSSASQNSYADGRIDLRVPFADKDKAKSLGARWDPVKKTWYVPADLDESAFKRWRG